jgi:hypothetical protein
MKVFKARNQEIFPTLIVIIRYKMAVNWDPFYSLFRIIC